MAGAVVTIPKYQFSSNGIPLIGGLVYSYLAGTTTATPTYQDQALTIENTNPIVLDARGECILWVDSTLTYKLKLSNAVGVEQWTTDNLTGPLTVSLTGSNGSSLVGFIQTGTGAVARTVQSKLREAYSVTDFGVVGDGVTDYTTAINAAVVAAAGAGRALYFPVGTYIVTQINAVANMKLIGEHRNTSIIKLKSGSNLGTGAAMIYSASLTIDDVWLENLRLDGNSSGNTQGDTLVITGQRPTFRNIEVINSAGNAIYTDWTGPSFRVTGFEGHFSNVTIDSSQKSSWLHRGPSDSHFDNIMIIDAGVKTNNAYYGMYLDPTGTGANGRFNNFHHWNRSSVTNVASAGMYIGSGGNTFTNSHFEGGNTSLVVAGSGNTFSACDYYAPRGSYAVNVTAAGSANKIAGIFGVTNFTGNANYTGLLLAGASNIIEMVSVGNIKGIEFADSSTGGNHVKESGYIGTGGAAYTGTYASNDIIDIFVQGTGGGFLTQANRNSNFSTFASSSQTLTASTYQTLSYANVNFDTLSEYSSSTNRFTAKTAGYYRFSASISFASATATTRALAIYKNGSSNCVLQYFGSQGQCILAGTSPPISLAIGDYVEVKCYTGLADTTTAASDVMYFGGYRIK